MVDNYKFYMQEDFYSRSLNIWLYKESGREKYYGDYPLDVCIDSYGELPHE